MKKLLKVSVFMYLLIIFIVFCFVTVIILFFNYKVEKSEIVLLRVGKNGGTDLIANAKTVINLREAKEIFININEKNIPILIETITPYASGKYIITIKGIGDLLPGEQIRVSIIYGYQSLIESLISSGV